jgi:DNA polymerase III gamma/tau subunit
MNEADIKLNVFRLIDNLQGEQLQQVYENLLKMLQELRISTASSWDLEVGYTRMANDKEREQEANEWIEATLTDIEA